MADEKKYIYYLSEYNWERGELIKENRTTFKIRNSYRDWNNPGAEIHCDKNIPKEKCAFPDEVVCIVQETWKGVNGRGSHRVEREKYPSKRVAAKFVSRQHYPDTGRVEE
jgi:hypothetical protein